MGPVGLLVKILVGHTVGLEQSWLVHPLSHSHSPFEHTPCLLHSLGHWFLRSQATPEYSGEQKQANEAIVVIVVVVVTSDEVISSDADVVWLESVPFLVALIG